MQLVNLNKKVPTEREIAEIENRLRSMKQAREEAKRQMISSLKSVMDEIPDALGTQDIIHLVSLLQSKLKGGHRKVRGSPVPPDLKSNLESALKQGDHTLSQLGKMFGLSISYISRVKRELGLTHPRKGYVDEQMKHQQPATA